ncbi:MAG: hypothetical protein MR450_05665 [Prevotella sp.]|nr:hypothetical protein [Prevotella sp.]MCI6618896.1 hypothetical protein [Prevotella sp.]MDY4037871.1 hypothetical protein [Prevotella sp.]
MSVEELSNEVRALIMNKEFIAYVFDPDKEAVNYWTLYLSNYPEITKSFNQAKYILQHLDSLKSCFREDEMQELKSQIRACIMHCHAN